MYCTPDAILDNQRANSVKLGRKHGNNVVARTITHLV